MNHQVTSTQSSKFPEKSMSLCFLSTPLMVLYASVGTVYLFMAYYFCAANVQFRHLASGFRELISVYARFDEKRHSKVRFVVLIYLC